MSPKPPRTLGDIFELQVEASPNNVAILYEDKRISYAELNARANRVAHDLAANHHVGPDTLVGLRVHRSDWMIVGVLGILKAGGAYVPIDPAYPSQRQAFMLADAGLHVLLTDEPGAPSTVGASVDGELRVRDLTSMGHDQPAENPARSTGAADLAYVIYTSGSTGDPKGVMIEHRSIVNTLSWRRRFYRFGPSDVTLQIPSMSFDSSVEDIFGMLLCGGALVIMRDEERYSLSPWRSSSAGTRSRTSWRSRRSIAPCWQRSATPSPAFGWSPSRARRSPARSSSSTTNCSQR